MSTLLYSLILLGCADDGSACQRLSLPAQRYEASSDCQADITAALQSEVAMRADYPMVEARCMPMRDSPRRPAYESGELASR
jgi:hypothetical protein